MAGALLARCRGLVSLCLSGWFLWALAWAAGRLYRGHPTVVAVAHFLEVWCVFLTAQAYLLPPCHGRHRRRQRRLLAAAQCALRHAYQLLGGPRALAEHRRRTRWRWGAQLAGSAAGLSALLALHAWHLDSWRRPAMTAVLLMPYSCSLVTFFMLAHYGALMLEVCCGFEEINKQLLYNFGFNVAGPPGHWTPPFLVDSLGGVLSRTGRVMTKLAAAARLGHCPQLCTGRGGSEVVASRLVHAHALLRQCVAAVEAALGGALACQLAAVAAGLAWCLQELAAAWARGGGALALPVARLATHAAGLLLAVAPAALACARGRRTAHILPGCLLARRPLPHTVRLLCEHLLHHGLQVRACRLLSLELRLLVALPAPAVSMATLLLQFRERSAATADDSHLHEAAPAPA